ncbi:MAG TPA: VapE domain-containing protein [Anaeromyxobacteraceae bacterium]|nr:VapE domain-containing protein [Anaeromyxobacteraceae bacterium]
MDAPAPACSVPTDTNTNTPAPFAGNTKTLTEQHARRLQDESGLSKEMVERSLIYSVLDEDEFRRLAKLPASAEASVPAMVFVYPGCDGFSRLRPDSSMKRNPDYHEVHGWSPYEKDEPRFVPGAKYLSPVGSTSRPYIRTDICEPILDPENDLWFVEGEKKTLAAIQAGLAAVGAPGVTCFGDPTARLAAKAMRKDVLRLHPDLRDIPLRGRKCVICFDSDIDEKDTVLKAAIALAMMLDGADADVHIAYLPRGSDGKKMGLDDHLAALPVDKRFGRNPLRFVEDTVRPFNVADCLDEYLEPEWDGLTEPQQDQELARLVRLASHIFKNRRDLQKFVKKCAKTLALSERQVERHVVAVEPERREDPRGWVAKWMSHREATFDSRTKLFKLGGQDVDSDYLFREMALDSVAFKGPSRQALDDALAVLVKKMRAEAVEFVRSRVKFDPSLGDKAIREFVLAVTGREEPLDVAVFKHFVWQVKRKLHGLDVERHLMPILFGAQGSGKSVAVEKLLSVIIEFTDRMGDLSCMSDDRHAYRLSESYVVFCDEMAKADKVSIDSLKNHITQPVVAWRMLGSNRTDTRPNIATFIGAANLELPDLITDPTGVRRFYQVTCMNPLNWKLINAIDYTAIWASVDENSRAPIESVLDTLNAHQEEMRVRDPVEEFVAECCVLGDEWSAGKYLHDEFNHFMRDDNRPMNSWTLSRFGRRLKSVLGPDGWKKSNGVKYRVTVRPGRRGTSDWTTAPANEPMAANLTA